jgi:FlaA1/EpsC-like NDP-sugar epimerase
MKDIVIIGAGDFGREVAWLIDDINKARPAYRIMGFLDDKESLAGKTVDGYEVLGNVEHIVCGCDSTLFVHACLVAGRLLGDTFLF